ncbi:MAG: histidinol-phosphatase [Clostridia bacterium]|nr:histidinol-phosphatase [Clostridia bacterium]
MILEDFHIHTNLCDGIDSPEDMVLEAIKLKMTRLGFSGHSYTDFDASFCMSQENTLKYADEIKTLKEKYKDKIEILCGIEQDYFSKAPTFSPDYVIGSVHYVKSGDNILSIDESEESFRQIAKDFYDGDYYAMAEDYFSLVGDVVRKTNADIIGHFDIITKFNEGNKLFDTQNPRYVKAATDAIDKLLPFGIPFEINMGAVARGYKTEPYPERSLLSYIQSRGGKVILSSDSHSKEGLCFEFEKYEKMALDVGFDEIKFKK